MCSVVAGVNVRRGLRVVVDWSSQCLLVDWLLASIELYLCLQCLKG